MQSVRECLPAFWEVLSRAPQLEKVHVYVHMDLLKPLTKQPHLASHDSPWLFCEELLAEWSQLLPARLQLVVRMWLNWDDSQQVPSFCFEKDWREV